MFATTPIDAGEHSMPERPGDQFRQARPGRPPCRVSKIRSVSYRSNARPNARPAASRFENPRAGHLVAIPSRNLSYR